jgi:hypothetical protein
LRPSEPDQRHLTGTVHWIRPPRLLPVVLALPFLGIIVDPDGRLRGTAQVNMMAKRKVAEAQLSNII